MVTTKFSCPVSVGTPAIANAIATPVIALLVRPLRRQPRIDGANIVGRRDPGGDGALRCEIAVGVGSHHLQRSGLRRAARRRGDAAHGVGVRPVPNTCWSARVSVAPLPKAAELPNVADAPAPKADALTPVATEFAPTRCCSYRRHWHWRSFQSRCWSYRRRWHWSESRCDVRTAVAAGVGLVAPRDVGAQVPLALANRPVAPSTPPLPLALV